MYQYTNNEFDLKSDFEIRTVREEDSDIDLLIPLELRTLNLYIDKMPNFLVDRFQFTEIRNIMIRITKYSDTSLCTIHLLKSVDIHSAIMNFTMDFENHIIEIIRNEYSVQMNLRRKSND